MSEYNYIFGFNLKKKKKAFKSSKKPWAQIFSVLCISKIVSGNNWEQALNESGVNTHCCDLIHSDVSLFLTDNN